TGSELIRMTGQADQVRCLAVAPDGKRALSGGLDKTLRLWDLDRGRELRRFDGVVSTVHAVVFSPDGRYVLGAGGDTESKGSDFSWMNCFLRLWEADSGREVWNLATRTPVYSAAFFPDGHRLLYGTGGYQRTTDGR